jgi:hypothetical protein
MMNEDALFSDDLVSLLGVFPQRALRDIVKIMKERRSWSPFPAKRYYEVHELPDDANFGEHVHAIAEEILWWGSNDIHRQFGEQRGWLEIVRKLAARVGVKNDERGDDLPAWRIEKAIVRHAFSDWEKLSPDQRQTKLNEAGFDATAFRGAGLGVFGGITALSAEELLAFLIARGSSSAAGAVGTVFLPPLAIILGMLWTSYDLAGPAYRVIRPIALNIALARWRLREERVAAAWEF